MFLTPGAKALIASCVVVVLLFFLVALLGVPEVLKYTGLFILKVAFRGFHRQESQSHAGANRATVDGGVMDSSATIQATDGSTSTSVSAPTKSGFGGLGQSFCFLLQQSRMRRLPRMKGHDECTGPAASTLNMQNEGQVVFSGIGTAFEGVTSERLEEFNESDLV